MACKRRDMAWWGWGVARLGKKKSEVFIHQDFLIACQESWERERGGNETPPNALNVLLSLSRLLDNLVVK